MFQGAIGMTYEQGGSGRAGRAIQTSVGDTLTLAYRIQNHTESGLSTIEAAGTHADRMLKEFSAFHRRNLEDPWGDYSGYLIPSTNDAARMAWLTELFDANGIEYGQASAPSKATGLDYADMSTHKLTISTGDLVVNARQPQSGLLQVLMDPNPELSDSLTYDITTWALPYAYGLDAYALTTPIPSTIEWTPIERDSHIQGDGPGYAYILNYQTDLGTPVLAQLLNHGVVVRLTKRPIVANGTTYPQGSLVITRRNNEAIGTTWQKI